MTEQVLNPHLHDQVPHVISGHSQKDPGWGKGGMQTGLQGADVAPALCIFVPPLISFTTSQPHFQRERILPEASAKAFPCHWHTAPLQTDRPTPRL